MANLHELDLKRMEQRFRRSKLGRMGSKSTRVKINRQKMKTRLHLQKKVSKEEQAYGTPEREWVDCDISALAFVQTLSGREIENSRMLVGTSTHRVTVPFIPTLTRKHRWIVARTGQIFEIGYINNVEQQNVKQICLCTEIGIK